MKPSERRALEAEKRAQKDAEQRESELLKGSSKWDSADTDDSKPRKESFFQNHVKLITFAICAVLILTVLGPWGVDRLVSKHRESIFGKEIDGKKDITVPEIVALANKGEALTWNDFEKYNFKDYSNEYREEKTNKKIIQYERDYHVDEMLYVKVIGHSINGRPDCVRLIYALKGDMILEIRGEDITDFLIRHGYIK
jgi:hypothetical protein